MYDGTIIDWFSLHLRYHQDQKGDQQQNLLLEFTVRIEYQEVHYLYKQGFFLFLPFVLLLLYSFQRLQLQFIFADLLEQQQLRPLLRVLFE